MDTENTKRNSLSSTSNEELKKLQQFFTNELYNSSQATDDLIRSFDKTFDDSLAKKALSLYQARYNSLDQPWEHVSFMYGLGIIYMHFNAYDWAIKAFRDILYVDPCFDRSRDIHLRLGLIFKALGRNHLSEKHFRIAKHDLRPKQNPTSANNSEQNPSVHNIKFEQPSRLHVNLCSDETRPPYHYATPPPYPPLDPSKSNSSPPSIFIETKKDLVSKRLQECCLSNPVTIMRNLATVLKLDLGLFSTKTLLETHPDHSIIVHSQTIPNSSQNIDTNDRKSTQLNSKSWKQIQKFMNSKLANYALYQAATFRDSLDREKKTKSNGPKAVKESGTESNESETNSKQSNSNQIQSNISNDIGSTSILNQCNTNNKQNATKKLKKTTSIEMKYIKSAHRIDLSNEADWKLQLHELNKMPSFIRCISASNLLTHLAETIPGFNTIEMSMHIPGCRIFGKKIENDFCCAYLNVGPGNYEWYSVSSEYSHILTKLCNNHGLEINDNNWWPDLEDLERNNIPFQKFSQRPGDLIWVNSGTIFWILSTGWCNNIHWNVGPLCAKQYRAAAVSYEINKLMFRRSQAPMIQLSWNVVININVILDKTLYQYVVKVLQRSIKYCMNIRKLIQDIQPVMNQVKGPLCGKYCHICDSEVFNICFVKKNDDWICCVECASKFDSTFEKFIIKQDYDIDFMIKLYKNFTQNAAISKLID